MSLTLVLGGARSGKSAHAERLVAAGGLPVRYVATARPDGDGMGERIERHRARRPADWETVESGGDIAAAALDDAAGKAVLVDGLGPWLARRLTAAGAFEEPPRGGDGGALAAVERLTAAAAERPEPTIVVIEEAGLGVHPPGAGSRRWVDLQGEAAQVLSARADRALLVVAGRAVELADAPLDRTHGDTLVRPGDADHAVNVLAGGPPDWLLTALHAALDDGVGAYPREGAAARALAAVHGRSPDEVVPTNGAAEALWLLGPALRPRLAACLHPAFTEAEAGLRAHGVPVTRVLRDPDADFAIDPAAVPAEADLVVIGNPASPSGTLAPAAAVLALRRPGRTLVVDEAFLDLVPGEPGSLAGEALTDVVVVRTLTKSLAIPGLRAGYALAAPSTANRLRGARPPWSANALALTALAAAAAHPAELAAAAERGQAERLDLERRLDELPGVRRWPAAANFVLIEVADGPAALARLRAAGIAVRPAASFPGLGANHLRLTARDAVANARLMEALA